MLNGQDRLAGCTHQDLAGGVHSVHSVSRRFRLGEFAGVHSVYGNV